MLPFLVPASCLIYHPKRHPYVAGPARTTSEVLSATLPSLLNFLKTTLIGHTTCYICMANTLAVKEFLISLYG